MQNIQKKYKISRISYTRYQRNGSTNHPHHLGTDVTFFLPRPPAPHEDIINQYNTPPLLLSLFFRFSGWWFCLFALGVVADVCWLFFHLELFSIILFAQVIYSGVHFFSLGDPHPPTYTHPLTLQGFCADAHRFTPKYWWVVGGVGWTTFRDSPYESEFILVTQVRAIVCYLLICS